jgi:hypothetical protein
MRIIAASLALFNFVARCAGRNIMTLAEHVENGVLVTDPGDTAVTIYLDCSSEIQWLSTTQGDTIGHMLERTYNQVRRERESDDSQLTNIIKLVGTMSWTGDFDCSLCPNDDDAVFLFVGGSGAALLAWEQAFHFAASKHEALANIEQCSIRIEAKAKLVQPVKNCHLRSCMDEQ